MSVMTARTRLLVLVAPLALLLAWAGTTTVGQDKEKKGGQFAAPPPAKWEYKTVQMWYGAKPEDMDKKFNELGAEGWELATSNFETPPNGVGQTYHVFKRPKR
jgi:hypothetical protein